MASHRFEGRIAGFGSSSGIRVVVGRWEVSPFGRFADAMIAEPDGHRVLIAPDDRTAEFVSGTYVFDEIRLEPITVVDRPGGSSSDPPGWSVASESLHVDLTMGPRTALGRLLRLVPRTISTAPAFATLADPVARRVLPGVRTRGVAREGRTEFYGAHDHHRLIAIQGTYGDSDLGDLADVDPPPAFGFSSTPRRPSVTSVVTTVRDRRPDDRPGSP